MRAHARRDLGRRLVRWRRAPALHRSLADGCTCDRAAPPRPAPPHPELLRPGSPPRPRAAAQTDATARTRALTPRHSSAPAQSPRVLLVLSWAPCAFFCWCAGAKRALAAVRRACASAALHADAAGLAVTQLGRRRAGSAQPRTPARSALTTGPNPAPPLPVPPAAAAQRGRTRPRRAPQHAATRRTKAAPLRRRGRCGSALACARQQG